MNSLPPGLSLDRAKSRSVTFATPCYRDISPWHHASMIETVSLLRGLGIACEVKMVVGVPVNDARNALANRFLATDHTDLVFIDADEGWDAWNIVRLLASEQPLIAAVGRKKTAAPDDDLKTWCMGLLPGTLDGVPTDAAGAIEVEYVGTGLMRINRSVFETMIAAHPEWERESAGTQVERFYEFFACDLDPSRKSRNGEDISFCHRWRALGGSTFVDPGITIRHFGTCEYGGNIGRFFEAAPSV